MLKADIEILRDMEDSYWFRCSHFSSITREDYRGLRDQFLAIIFGYANPVEL